MGSNFPTSNDTFSVPTTPETTPLSSAGTANRNHTESHRDLGDAVTALQQNVATLTHDHSNTGTRPTPKLKQANTHESNDKDNSPDSLHHSLGTGVNQAAPGNHTHDSRYPQLDQLNTFTQKQTFTGGFSVPNGQWASAAHTHESAAQGGISLPWKHAELRSTNVTLATNKDATWDFTVPALPIMTDLDIQVILALGSNDAKFQQIDFSIRDVTGTSTDVTVDLQPTWRRPTATSDKSRQQTMIFGLSFNVPKDTVRKYRVVANNGSAASSTIVYSILFKVEPFNNF